MQIQLNEFEKNYAGLVEKDILLAKEYFAENFTVKCFGCEKLVKPTKLINCPNCGIYLD